MQFIELKPGMIVDYKLNKQDKMRVKDVDQECRKNFRAKVIGVYPYIATLEDKKGNKHTITKLQMITREIDLMRVKHLDKVTGMLKPATTI